MEVVDNDDKMCMMRGCTEVDLLPAKCISCRKLFCTKHIAYADHHCSNYERSDNVAPVCPLCQRPVSVRPGQSADHAVNSHIESGCAPADSSQSQAFETTRGGRVAARQNFCSFGDCRRNEIQLILCDRCGSSFCVDHRAPLAHKCPRSTPPPQKVVVSPHASSTPQLASGQRPASPQAAPVVAYRKKLTQMAFQNTAAKPFSTGGNSGSDGHVVVGVFFPPDANINPCYFDVAPNMVVGRFIDIVAKQVDLPNRNNATLPDSQRLCMFNLAGCMLLPTSLRVDEAIGDGGGAAMLMLTRGPTLPAGVEEEIAAIAGNALAAPASGNAAPANKRDCSVM